MPIRPGWHDEYWKKLDKETARKIRTPALAVVALRRIITSSLRPGAALSVNISS